MIEMPAQPNFGLYYGIECLFAVIQAGRPIGPGEIAAGLGLDSTKVSRLLGTLAAMGLTQKTASRKYLPGPGINVMAAMGLKGSAILKAAIEPIRELGEKTGLNVSLGCLWRGQVAYLYHGKGRGQIEAMLSGTQLYPANMSSIGMVLLSEYPDEEAFEIVSQCQAWAMGRAAAVVEKDAFLSELRDVRGRGYGVNLETGQSLAVAIGRPGIAGLAVFGDIEAASRDVIVASLRQAAVEIEKNL